MTEFDAWIDDGDLVQYCGKTKTIAGRDCEVIKVLPCKIFVAYRSDAGAIVTRHVLRKNVKKLAGGGNT